MNQIVKIVLFYIPLIALTIILSIKNKQIKWYSFVKMILIGMFAVIPTAIIQFLIPSLDFRNNQSFLYLFLSVLIFASIEEICKTTCLLLISSKNYDIKSFFVLALIVGFSFGTFEIEVYLITGMKNVEIRLLTSVLLHTVCTGIASFFIWFVKHKKCHISLILTPILIHSIYNFFSGFPGRFWLFSLIVILYAIFQCSIFYQMFIKSEKELV